MPDEMSRNRAIGPGASSKANENRHIARDLTNGGG